MFWGYIRVFKSLPVRQHSVVFLTTFAIPVSFELVQGLQGMGLCLSCVNVGKLTLYFVWYQIAMLVIASATRRDRTRAEEKLHRVHSELTDSISQISEEHRGQMTAIQDRVRDLHEWVQNIDRAMRDELGVALPPPVTSLGMSARAGRPRIGFNLAASSPTGWSPTGWRGRLFRWLKGQARNLKKWARKVLVDWAEG